MAIVYGEIGSLTSLLKKLNNYGIYYLNSLEDIRNLKYNYGDEIKKIEEKKKIQLVEYIDGLKNELKVSEGRLELDRMKYQELLINEEERLKFFLENYNEKINDLFFRILYFYKKVISQNRYNRLSMYFDDELKLLLRKDNEKIVNIKNEIVDKESNNEDWVRKLSSKECGLLIRGKEIIESNKQIYLGALGEYRALKVLRNLPNSYVVINDFHKKLDIPIPDKENDEKIFSVQIDHVVVGPTGVYIIETKNWSKNSMENKNLFSPIKQLHRLSLAMFILLNKAIERGDIDYFNQYWGKTKVSPKNILLTIRYKPKEEFQFVKVLTLDEVNRQITNNVVIFSHQQIEAISDYLLKIRDVY